MLKLKNKSENTKIVLKNVISAFLLKGLSLVVSFFSVPAFVSYFNDDLYLGVWYTLLSIIMWFLSFDLGIGNGIRNRLTIALTNNNRREAKKIISSGFFSILTVSLMVTLILIILLYSINLQDLFNIKDNYITEDILRLSVIYVIIAVMLRFALTTITSIFYSLQLSSINNMLALIVSLLQFGFVFVLHFKTPGEALVNLSIYYIFSSNLPVVISAVWIFNKKLKDCKPSVSFVDKNTIKKIMSIGGVFLFCQILYMLIVNTNEFLITKFYGANYTVYYTFYYRLTSIISMVTMLVMTPVWSVVTKTIEEKNYTWLLLLYKKIKIAGIIVFIIEIVLIPFLQIIMNVWLGEYTIQVNYLTALSFAIFGGWFAYSSMLSTIVCGMARMKIQVIFYSVGVLIKFGGVVFCSQILMDWTLVIWLNAFVLCAYSIAQQISLDKFLKNVIKKNNYVSI